MRASYETDTNAEAQYGLTKTQEVFLFGNQGTILDEDDLFLVWHHKMGFAREWLAQFVPVSDVPQEYTDNKQEIEKIFEYNNIRRSGIEDPHPLAYALHDEQNHQQALENRPVLATSLIYAEKALVDDSEAKKKIEYVLALFEEYDRRLTNSGLQGGDTSPIRLPEPVESYTNEAFPMHLSGSKLLF